MSEDRELSYLKLLSKSFPTIEETAAEIINLEAILSLPKGTEHFISDIHGEYDAFNHLLKNCSGVIREKIESIFGNTICSKEKKQLATVIYYPKEKIELIKNCTENMDIWYEKTIHRILKVLEVVASKYTRSKVRKALSKDFSYIIQELLYEREGTPNKIEYVKGIINTIISIDRGKEFIVNLSILIQKLTVDSLHIVGDIYDRGPYPHKIIDRLMEHHNVDIQWGNHDILWVGAASGQLASIANAVRISLRYGNTEVLEEGYGINLLPLATFAMEEYKDDLCKQFVIKAKEGSEKKNLCLLAKMHKAISIIQFKLEEKTIKNNPEFEMNDRLLLEKIDIEKNIITIDEKQYFLNDQFFPTLKNGFQTTLTPKEQEVIDSLLFSFKNSEKLQKHIQFLLEKGNVYLKRNSNLIYHGCIPLDKFGNLREVNIFNSKLKGKKLLETLEGFCKDGYYNANNTKAKDFLWYLWCGKDSPLFGKDKMRTFERYFIDEKETHKEIYDYYYDFYENEEVLNTILKEFKLPTDGSNIVSGHVPVKVKKGEKPIKGKGKLLLIDGGFSKAYQPTTGIAGYTLIFNSYGKRLISHTPFDNTGDYVENCLDVPTTTEIIESRDSRLRVRDTDIGKELISQINDLKKLLNLFKGADIV
ncbi:fructose-1,6-bisphosphatase [Cetobacterium sp. 2A]|uniref:fructose-1,6-bisphosphatase n=1 Tax=Cetobacterium sp. 2A TaxID=2754723 RepID=UPI0021077A96|nr:fructose-1,6-bisphosphatase [Cetobacterium sp. 2A]